MTKEINIEKYGRDAVVSSPAAVFSYQVEETSPDFTRGRSEEGFSWANSYTFFGDLDVLPYGTNNDMPQLLRNTVYNNPNIPGIFEKKQGLLWGQGPHLYRESFVNGKLQREWTLDNEITDWLESWDYKDYLLNTITDFNFIQGSFTKVRRALSSRIGKDRIHSLEHVNPLWCRLGRKQGAEQPTHAIVSDVWKNGNLNDVQTYHLFDPREPFKRPNSVLYSRTYTFATDNYAIPTIFGALEWIRRSTAVPLILKALSKNSINAKYHITSPAQFWDNKKEELQEKCQADEIDYTDELLQDYERTLFQTIIKTLAGEGEAGKIWHTKNIMMVDGVSLQEVGWKIEPIDQNIKDFVETQIKIADKADSAVSAAVGIHKALGGITANGKADSGSEQLYAYLMYKLIGVDIPEYVVTKAINHAIRANFPQSGLKLGFYHEEAQRQQDQTSADRIKNN